MTNWRDTKTILWTWQLVFYHRTRYEFIFLISIDKLSIYWQSEHILLFLTSLLLFLIIRMNWGLWFHVLGNLWRTWKGILFNYFNSWWKAESLFWHSILQVGDRCCCKWWEDRCSLLKEKYRNRIPELRVQGINFWDIVCAKFDFLRRKIMKREYFCVVLIPSLSGSEVLVVCIEVDTVWLNYFLALFHYWLVGAWL